MSQIQEAIKAIKTGDKKTGQRILQQLVEINPDNETAWMWFAAAADEPYRKKQYLKRVLEINPNNTIARQGLNQLEGDEPKEELPKLNDIVPNSSLPQTEFITKTELARKTSLTIAIVCLVFPLYSVISLMTLLILNLEYMGQMIFSCRSMGVSADRCTQPAGWIMIGIIIISSIITYFSAQKIFTMLQAKKWGGCIIFGIIFVIFLGISIFLPIIGPAVLILMETFWA